MRGWVWRLSMLWVVMGAGGAGYAGNQNSSLVHWLVVQPTMVQTVIDGHLQVSARRHHQQHHKLRDRQAELIEFPAGAGEEVVRPVMRPGVLQAAAEQHADDSTAAHLAAQPGGQAAERGKARRGETRPQHHQQAQQRGG